MKKFLFLAAAAAVGLSASAQISGIKLDQPQIVRNAVFQKLSPNGRFAASVNDGEMIVFDFQTGQAWDFAVTGDEVQYDAGRGNSITNDGFLVGSTTFNGTAAYLQDGKWTELPVPHQNLPNLAHGVTPDAGIICGVVGMASNTSDSDLSEVPCIWVRNADGTYADPVVLPHPMKDFTGRTPQMATALSISADGKRIIGQVVDFSGMMPTPIIYNCDDNGTWTYDWIGEKLANPGNLTLPEFPAELRDAPQIVDYMSAEEKAKYEKDLQDYNNGISNVWPDPLTYITPEEAQKYNEDSKVYNAEAEEYAKKLEEFNLAFAQIFASGMSFEFNDQYANSDCSLFTSSRRITEVDPNDPMNAIRVYVPYLFTVPETGEVSYKAFGNGMEVCAIGEDGTLVGWTAVDGEPESAHVIPAGQTERQPIIEYISSRNASLGAWMKENMTHDLEFQGETVVTGIPTCSLDLSTFATYAPNYWDMSQTAPNWFGYVFNVNNEVSGVEQIGADTAAADVKAFRGGRLEVNGTADIEVYSTDGTRLYSAKAVSGQVETGLEGLCIVKATPAAGKPAYRKVTF